MELMYTEVDKASQKMLKQGLGYASNTRIVDLTGVAVATIDAIIEHEVLSEYKMPATAEARRIIHRDVVAFVTDGVNYAGPGMERKYAEAIISAVSQMRSVDILCMVKGSYKRSTDLLDRAESLEELTADADGMPLQAHGYRDDPRQARDYLEQRLGDNHVEVRFQ